MFAKIWKVKDLNINVFSDILVSCLYAPKLPRHFRGKLEKENTCFPVKPVLLVL